MHQLDSDVSPKTSLAEIIKTKNEAILLRNVLWLFLEKSWPLKRQIKFLIFKKFSPLSFQSRDWNLCCSFIIWLGLLQTSDEGKIFEHIKDLLEMKSTPEEVNALILFHSFGFSLTQKRPNLQPWPSRALFLSPSWVTV